jgi:hypothetical protein
MMDLLDTNIKLAREFDKLKDFVIEKNVEYNNSLQNPISVFQPSKMDGILGRLDDKLNRIKHAGINEHTMDTIDDLVGYLVHLKIMIKND